MALIECPECGKKISENAESCPNCGNPMNKKKEIDTAKIDAEFDAQKKSSSNIGCTKGLLIVGAVFIFGIILMSSFSGGSGGSSSGNSGPNHDKSTAWIMTQDFVEKRLSSPSTAEFPNSSNSGVEIKQSSTTYNINGFVDSENGFGAMIRTNFQAEVRYDGGGTWSLISLEFE